MHRSCLAGKQKFAETNEACENSPWRTMVGPMTTIQSQIAAWLLAALVHWTPSPRGPVGDAVAQERVLVARSLVEIAYSPDEPPLPMFARANDARARTALLLGSIAAHESGLLPRLAAGRCLPGECDGGRSFGLGQTQLGPHGLALIPGGGYRRCDADTVACLTPAELVDDVPGQLRVALHILRSDGLRSYCGEISSVDAPSARRREMSAQIWYERHPPPAIDLAAMADFKY